MTAKLSRAFTLIELLVVIAIISLLAAILFPAFATARDKARQSACSTNMKQLALGLLQYAQDNDESFACGYFRCNQATYCTTYSVTYQYPALISTGSGWGGQVYPYIKSAHVFQCPADPTPDTATLTPPSYNVSYAYNGLVGSSCTAPVGLSADVDTNAVSVCSAPYPYAGYNVSKITVPASVVLLDEVQNAGKGSLNVALTLPDEGYATLFAANKNYYQTPASTGAKYGYAWQVGTGFHVSGYGLFNGPNGRARHDSGGNYAFADGHIRWLPAGLYTSDALSNTAKPSALPTGIVATYLPF